jgi:hypothetical protein
MDNVHTNQVFAPIDPDHTLERVAGGNETEVYRSDDGTWVAKLKSELGSDAAGALAEAQAMRAAAEDFAACLGPMFSIPSDFIIASDDAGRCQILVMQPYLQGARSLYELDYATLSASQRSQLATQLRVIIDRSLAHYRATGSMPDLYGRTSANQAERRRLNGPLMLPWRIWSFLVQRNLLRSHNLMLTDEPEPRVVLVDYDPVRRGWLYRWIYYAVRRLLFWRDLVLIRLILG